ncbi:polymer-forming cytoskeletal protein [Alphaproteobacteria bacterium]|nr:polymer-forming cytoskeletal protein [Alphaproteobacteria bacterium]MDC1120345.1 polymer-forming cytoskeletal protein [Alphaproteobacteria bacterium]
MDKATGNKAVIAAGAHFKGQIKHARSIEINGVVEADLTADKVTIGPDGKFVGAINADLVVISGDYNGTMDAGSIWATATAKIAGKIQYKTLQMDRGAALNCRVVHNWKPEKSATKKQADKEAKDTSKPDIALGGEAGVTESTPESALLQSPELPQHASEANNVADDDALKTLAESAADEVTPKKQPASGRRLGIFGFGSKAAKLPDASS